MEEHSETEARMYDPAGSEFLSTLDANERERLVALGIGLLRECHDGRQTIAKLQAQKKALEEAAEALQNKVNALMARRDELKRDVRFRIEENESLKREIETLRDGMSGLAYAHGRLVTNYNDQLRSNRTLLVRLGELRSQLTELMAEKDPSGTKLVEAEALQLPALPASQNGDTSYVTRPFNVAALRTLSKMAVSTEKFVSTKYGFIYLAVPKAASQSVIRALWELHPGATGAFVSTLSLQELFSRHPAYWRYLKFSVVRHPFARAVSCYIDKVLDADPIKSAIFARVGEANLPSSFEEFVGFLCQARNQDENSDRHWVSQSALLTDLEGNLLVDHVARCESLEADLGGILGRLGLALPPMRRVNVRSEHLSLNSDTLCEQASLDDAHYHTPELEARLRERYRRDYDLFGYAELKGGERPLPEPTVETSVERN